MNEQEAWVGRSNDIFDCEECGEYFNLSGAIIDWGVENEG